MEVAPPEGAEDLVVQEQIETVQCRGSIVEAATLDVGVGKAAPGGAIPCIAQSFDAVTLPALPAGWTATNALGADPRWVTDATR